MHTAADIQSLRLAMPGYIYGSRQQEASGARVKYDGAGVAGVTRATQRRAEVCGE